MLLFLTTCSFHDSMILMKILFSTTVSKDRILSALLRAACIYSVDDWMKIEWMWNTVM